MADAPDLAQPVLDRGIRGIATALRRGETTAGELATELLARIEARNGGAPSEDGSPDAINAWEHLDPATTLQQAAEADRRLAAGDPSPLLGVPVGVKAVFAVEGQPWTASSRVLAGRVADRDSAAWSALAAAGAVYAGHTHTHEFAAGGTTDQVGNPWDPRRSAGGSSGGSGAALAAGMVPLALGTDTAGSLRIPAAFSGVSAFKGSFGRVPLDGVIPLGVTLDHAGPMARTLEDCAIAYEVLSSAARLRDPFGVGARSAVAVPAPIELRGLRVAVTDRVEHLDLELDPDLLEGLARAREALRGAGAEIVELAAAPDLSKADYDAILVAEARAVHAEYAARAADYRPSTRAFIAFGSAPSPVDAYLAAQRRRLAVTAEWDAWFRTHRIDVVLEPTLATLPPLRGHGYDADAGIGGTDPLICLTATWDVTGSPVAALPTGLGSRSGLPVGVSLIGAADDDARVLAIGIALQRLLGVPVR